MPRPPRLLPPPRISRPPPSAPLSFPTARSPPTIATTGKRPRSTSTRDYSSSSPGYPTHTPKLAWLAAEIKRLAYPPSSSSPPSPHAEPPYHHHPPQTNPYFPTPVFPLRGQDIHCLAEPPEFYEAILERIRAATSRVTLSALYLGTGEMERRLVHELTQACQRRPGLRVRVLLDHSRAQRGGPGRDSLSTLAPLLAACPRQAEVALFRMPQLAGPWGRRIPSPLNEVVAVSHLKALVFDDTLILTGANLSRDYFTNRQDRYVAIQNAGALAAFYHELVALLARFPALTSTTAAHHPDDTTSSYINPRGEEDNSTMEPPPSSSTDPFTALARALRRHWGQPPFSSFPDAVAAADTLALPTLQCAPLGIRHEERLLLALLRSHAAVEAEGLAARGSAWWELTLATAYLNPPPHLLEVLAGWRGPLSLLAPSAAAHGFAGAEGLKAWIPLAYQLHEHRCRQLLHALRAAGGGASEGGAGQWKGRGKGKGGKWWRRDRLHRYARPGWTFHGKGLWLLPSRPGAGHGLSLTVAGSSNYGVRSFERDLESQVLLLSRDLQLRDRLVKEKTRLLKHAEEAPPVGAAAVGDPFPLWRRLWLPRLAEWTRGYL